MRSSTRKLLTSGIFALGIAVPVVLAVEAAHQPSCDRACLLQVADSYVNGLLAHRTADLPVSADVTASENGRTVPIGEGVWRTAKRLSSRQTVADATSGEAGVFGVVTASDGLRAEIALRLKVAGQRVREAATVVSEP